MSFTRKIYARPPLPVPTPIRKVAPTVITAAAPRPKDQPVRDEAYRRAVAALPCIICGAQGISQAAHANYGKGMGLKACDSQTFPVCATAPGRRGCHEMLDQGALYDRDERRALEQAWAERTRQRLERDGIVCSR